MVSGEVEVGGLLWGVNYWVCGVDLKWVVVAMYDNAYYWENLERDF